MRGHERSHDPPGLSAEVLVVDHAAEGADERGEGLLGDVAVAHDGVVALQLILVI